MIGVPGSDLELVGALNALAGTTGLGAAGAANALAAAVVRTTTGANQTINGPVTITPPTNAVALTVNAQGLDIQEWVSGGTVRSYVDVFGNFGVRTTTRFDAASLSVGASTSTNQCIVCRPASGVTVDIQTWEDSSGNPIHSINSAGLPKWTASSTVQTTVGAAGGASALPATPLKYLKVVDNSGNTLVVPAYNP